MIKSILFAWRIIAGRKLFSTVIILTMSVGIGASTSIFSFVNGILLKPLPFPEAEKLFVIESVKAGEVGRISQREVQDIMEGTTIFEDIAGYNPAAQYNLTKHGEPEEIPTTICSQNLFDVLGVKMIRGSAWPEEFDGRRAFGIVL